MDETEKPLPAPLSSDDVIRYQKIFGLQELGKWKLADKLIKQLKDPLLLGHVLSQRYLHPTKYRTRYKELKRWLDKYADHPRARQLYKLALRRKPKRWRAPRSPYPWAVAGMHGKSLKAMPKPPRKRLSKKDRQRATQLKRQIRWHLRKGWTKSVKNTLGTREARRVFSTVDMDWARARLGAGYFAAGRDEWSIKWAGPAAKRSGRYLPQAHWTVGLMQQSILKRLQNMTILLGLFLLPLFGPQGHIWLIAIQNASCRCWKFQPNTGARFTAYLPGVCWG
ncbi:MAG: hypothetical protein ACKVIF_02570 [Rhodospirillales bacterium]